MPSPAAVFARPPRPRRGPSRHDREATCRDRRARRRRRRRASRHRWRAARARHGTVPHGPDDRHGPVEQVAAHLVERRRGRGRRRRAAAPRPAVRRRAARPAGPALARSASATARSSATLRHSAADAVSPVGRGGLRARPSADGAVAERRVHPVDDPGRRGDPVLGQLAGEPDGLGDRVAVRRRRRSRSGWRRRAAAPSRPRRARGSRASIPANAWKKATASASTSEPTTRPIARSIGCVGALTDLHAAPRSAASAA